MRVVDASVMPQATAGDMIAPTLVMAERMADPICGRHLPEALGAEHLAVRGWATERRSPAIPRVYASEQPALREALLANAKGLTPLLETA